MHQNDGTSKLNEEYKNKIVCEPIVTSKVRMNLKYDGTK